MKIAVVGNSHITMLKEGLAEVEGHLNAFLGPIKVVFFGVVGRRIRMCSVNDEGIFGWHGARALEPSEPDDIAARLTRINGTDQIDLNGFDVLVGVGFYALPTWTAGIVCNVAIEGIHDLREAPHALSFETYLSMVEAGKNKVSQVDWLRNVPCPMSLCIEAPMVSQSRFANQSVDRDECLTAKALTPGNAFHGILEDAASFAQSALQERGTVYVPQPPETLATSVSSCADHMGGLLAIDGSQRPAGDEYHGNHLMGAAYWRAICDHLKSMKSEHGGAHALGS